MDVAVVFQQELMDKNCSMQELMARIVESQQELMMDTVVSQQELNCISRNVSRILFQQELTMDAVESQKRC